MEKEEKKCGLIAGKGAQVVGCQVYSGKWESKASDNRDGYDVWLKAFSKRSSVLIYGCVGGVVCAWNWEKDGGQEGGVGGKWNETVNARGWDELSDEERKGVLLG